MPPNSARFSDSNIPYLMMPHRDGGCQSVRSLAVLNLSSNKLTKLLPEIGNLTALTHLVLRNYQLTALPPEMSPLGDRGVVKLSGNPLKG